LDQHRTQNMTNLGQSKRQQLIHHLHTAAIAHGAATPP